MDCDKAPLRSASQKCLLQMRVMEAAKAAPNLASAMNIGAFNFGNAIGAAVGGAVINAGLGYPAISLAGALMAGLGLLMVLGLGWRSRRKGSGTCAGVHLPTIVDERV